MTVSFRRVLSPAVAFAITVALRCQVMAMPPVERVLVIDQEGPTRPAFVQLMEGLREGLAEATEGRYEVFIENLDLVRLGRSGDNPDQAAGWLVEKYRDSSFDVVVPTSSVIRDFVLANRERLSPGATIVAVERPGDDLEPGDAPREYTSVTGDDPGAETVALAHRLVPRAVRVAFVGQSLPHPGFLAAQVADARRSAREQGMSYVSLVDLPLAELRPRLRDLPGDSVVIFQGYWQDEHGRTYVPAEILETLCRESSVPFFGLVDTHVGRGVVGGVCADLRAMGRAAGRLVVAAREGATPVPVKVPSALLFDERALNRFGLSTSNLPAGSRVLFHEPRLWKRYWPQIVGGVAVVAIETALIIALVTQLRLRRRAERIIDEQRDQIAHAGRVSTLGQFAASLAHELGQPLGAILNNLEAAEILLRSDESAVAGELREIVADIAADDRRAGEVLDRIRAMVRKQRFSVGPVDVPGLIRGVIALAGPRLEVDAIGVSVACDPGIPRVAGDEVLLQQALLNLVANSADAIRGVGVTSTVGSRGGPGIRHGSGTIEIRAGLDGDTVELSVIDNGGGFEDNHVEGALEPFSTTKPEGLGMGLPIVRSIVEQHEGVVRFDNEPGHGLTVRIRLPVWTQERVA
jgi:signal transduction histidine kinase